MLDFFSSLDESTVKTKISVDSWEGAVDQVGTVMVNAGIVTESYIDAMKEAVRQLGPYCVIAPGIALPHARPEDGVLRSGFSLITLATPVEFGNVYNDPVDIIIGLAAVDKESHVEALRELARYFRDSRFVRSVRLAKTIDELIKIVNLERKES